MAVLIEAISVVIRCEAIAKKFFGGIENFKASLPNSTLCADGELASVSFMTPVDVKNYVDYLVEQGLVFKECDTAIDLVVVDQKRGVTSECNWTIFGKADWNNDPDCPISVCQHVPSKIKHVVVPEGWNYVSSLSVSSYFVDQENIPPSLKFVRREGNLDVLHDENTSQEFFVRRT
ncbi:hypothetical protein RF679_00750 [Undibacterium cyanobacteriorum]|uniref:Uncharacterized protein n=1 Tax=Undibacterium cyanobacteriorum TaxID=3073561 RepID=A0ABY9RIZ5_9BURK|nr:hypothetical protein [Undibacterium sp. 20NA77.5]WMW80824.1 hypothetical protein RF679_00750 [Undibacterium sp. 20NA77.5]